MSIIDPVLDYIEDRIEKTMWTYGELDSLSREQLRAINELTQSALADARIKFKTVKLVACDE